MKRLLFIVIVLISTQLHAQVLTPVVMVSGGGFVSNGKVSLSSTIGQAFGTVLISKQNKTYIQGFAPIGNVTASPVKKRGNENVSVEIYPNPAVNDINIEIRSPGTSEYSVEIYDVFGKKAIVETKELSSVYTSKISMDLSTLVPGQYFIRLVSISDRSKAMSFKIIKSSNL